MSYARGRRRRRMNTDWSKDVTQLGQEHQSVKLVVSEIVYSFSLYALIEEKLNWGRRKSLCCLALSLIHETRIILLTCVIQTRSIIKRERTNVKFDGTRTARIQWKSFRTVYKAVVCEDDDDDDEEEGDGRGRRTRRKSRTHLYLFLLSYTHSLSRFLLSESLRLLCKDEQRKREREYYSHTLQLGEVPRTAERKIFNESLIVRSPQAWMKYWEEQSRSFRSSSSSSTETRRLLVKISSYVTDDQRMNFDE